MRLTSLLRIWSWNSEDPLTYAFFARHSQLSVENDIRLQPGYLAVKLWLYWIVMKKIIQNVMHLSRFRHGNGLSGRKMIDRSKLLSGEYLLQLSIKWVQSTALCLGGVCCCCVLRSIFVWLLVKVQHVGPYISEPERLPWQYKCTSNFLWLGCSVIVDWWLK